MSSTEENILIYTIIAGFLSIVYGFLTGKNILNSSAEIIRCKKLHPQYKLVQKLI